MTLNNVIKRVETISLAHLQIRGFYFGRPTDFLVDKTTRYAGVFLQKTSGAASLQSREIRLGFKMFFLDLVNVAADAKENELEVQSDMLSVAKDIIATMNSSTYTDWAIDGANNLVLVEEEFDDMVAGVVIDFSIRLPWDKSYCESPTE